VALGNTSSADQRLLFGISYILPKTNHRSGVLYHNVVVDLQSCSEPGIWTMHPSVGDLMYEKYLQISVHLENHKDCVYFDHRLGRPKDDITRFCRWVYIAVMLRV
jgi:hypothetical protein